MNTPKGPSKKDRSYPGNYDPRIVVKHNFRFNMQFDKESKQTTVISSSQFAFLRSLAVSSKRVVGLFSHFHIKKAELWIPSYPNVNVTASVSMYRPGNPIAVQGSIYSTNSTKGIHIETRYSKDSSRSWVSTGLGQNEPVLVIKVQSSGFTDHVKFVTAVFELSCNFLLAKPTVSPIFTDYPFSQFLSNKELVVGCAYELPLDNYADLKSTGSFCDFRFGKLSGPQFGLFRYPVFWPCFSNSSMLGQFIYAKEVVCDSDQELSGSSSTDGEFDPPLPKLEDTVQFVNVVDRSDGYYSDFDKVD